MPITILLDVLFVKQMKKFFPEYYWQFMSLFLTSTKTTTVSRIAKVQIKLSFPVKAPQQPKKPRMSRNAPNVPRMKAPSAQCPSENAKY